MISIPSSRYFTDLGPISCWREAPGGFVASVAQAEVVVTAVCDSAFRIEVRHPWSGDVLASAFSKPAAVDPAVEVTESGGRVSVATRAGTLFMRMDPLEIVVVRADGSTVFQAAGAGVYSHLNDEFRLSRRSTPDELVLGLGEKTGALNRKGRDFTLWNTDVLNPNSAGEFVKGLDAADPRSDPTSTEFDPYYISIPFYQTIDSEGRAAGFAIDNTFRGHYSFSDPETTSIQFAGGRYVETIFLGPDLPGVIREYTALTGRIGVPPIWALGHHYCRWHPYHQADVIALAKRFREKKIPCDSLWLDIDHMDGYRVFTWDADKFPDPEDMVCDLARDGFRAVTIVDPGVKVNPGWDVYDTGLKEDVFCKTPGGAVYQGQVWPGRTAFPDFATARARAWWGDLNGRHIERGLAGIWNDMNEPATGDIPCDRMLFDGGKVSHASLHNAYATLMAMSTHEGLLRVKPDERPFILSRAGSAGIQRYAANWLGDNMSRWDHLALSLPMTMGLGLSGQPFVGADIGGFGEASGGELLARWYQAAALSPFCRNHNAIGNPDQYPWSFGPEVEEICRKSIELRYRLLPYLYSAFVEASLTGAPVMRPMAWDFPEDRAVRELGDQYLLGPSLLIAPVLEAGGTSRSLTLPFGEWIDWHTGGSYHAGALTVRAPLGSIPIFVRAGSIVPMWPVAPPSTKGYGPETIELRVAVPADDGITTSTLVEDDGESFDFERGERLTTTFTVSRMGRDLRVAASTEGRTYAGFARRAFKIVLLGSDAQARRLVEASTQGFDELFNLGDTRG